MIKILDMNVYIPNQFPLSIIHEFDYDIVIYTAYPFNHPTDEYFSLNNHIRLNKDQLYEFFYMNISYHNNLLTIYGIKNNNNYIPVLIYEIYRERLWIIDKNLQYLSNIIESRNEDIFRKFLLNVLNFNTQNDKIIYKYKNIISNSKSIPLVIDPHKFISEMKDTFDGIDDEINLTKKDISHIEKCIRKKLMFYIPNIRFPFDLNEFRKNKKYLDKHYLSYIDNVIISDIHRMKSIINDFNRNIPYMNNLTHLNLYENEDIIPFKYLFGFYIFESVITLTYSCNFKEIFKNEAIVHYTKFNPILLSPKNIGYYGDVSRFFNKYILDIYINTICEILSNINNYIEPIKQYKKVTIYQPNPFECMLMWDNIGIYIPTFYHLLCSFPMVFVD